MKYYLTYNINKGGSTDINPQYPGTWGDLEGNNKRKLISHVNNILRSFNAKKGSPFNWWYDITTIDNSYKKVVTNIIN